MISLAQIANLNNVSIAATVSADSPLFGQVGSIVLDLNNGQKTQTENATPYALFGDNRGNFRGGSIPLGANTITFNIFSGTGGNGTLLGTVTRNFTIADIPPVNLAPNAVGDAFTTVADQTFTGNVALNDSDPNGDALTFALGSAASNGTVVLGANGIFEYIPNLGFTGTDSFSYTASDGLLTDIATVDLLVNPQGLSPLQIGLYDASSDQLIQFIQSGDTIDTAGLSAQNLTLAAVLADGSPLAGQVQSIELDLNNGQATRTENVSPYALFGDTNGNFFTGSGLPQGANQIEFELYSQKGGNGLLLETVVVDFTLV
ncbi:MAG: cadherin-like domain-containing protein [Leptolyngbya sp. RL_3_1]|nr:cadherin-like domain-containing protein [Leptolyngbya sp. RL_3_1]